MSDRDILAISPRMTQIKLYELAELELEEKVVKYIERGVKPEEFEGEILRKYDEMRGLNVGEFTKEDLTWTAKEKEFIRTHKTDPRLS
jgi:hypothetical protein